MSEEDVARFIAWEHSNISSDGMLQGAHPRGFGAFPRVLGRYVRKEGVLTVEEAVRKMTSLPARNMGLRGRGTIAPGQHVDLVLFDPDLVVDRSTTAQPHLHAEGIVRVWVNGVTVWQEGAPTRARPGRVLRRTER